MLQFSDISITRSYVTPGAYVLQVECNGCRYTGEFVDFGAFLMSVTEMTKFFAVRAGHLRVKDAGLTRQVKLGTMDNKVLPGDH